MTRMIMVAGPKVASGHPDGTLRFSVYVVGRVKVSGSGEGASGESFLSRAPNIQYKTSIFTALDLSLLCSTRLQ